MPTVKTVNYTPEMVTKLVSAYQAAGTGMTDADHDARDAVVQKMAVELDRKVRSIRSKLVTTKDENGKSIYIKRGETSAVTGAKPEKKDVMSENLVESAGDTSAVSKLVLSAESVEKMNKPEIAIITAQFNALHERISELETENDEYFDAFGALPETDEPDENDSQEGETES